MTDDAEGPNTVAEGENKNETETSGRPWLVLILIAIFLMLTASAYFTVIQHYRIEKTNRTLLMMEANVSEMQTLIQQKLAEAKPQQNTSLTQAEVLLQARFMAQMADNQLQFGQQAFALQLLSQSLNNIKQLNDAKLITLQQTLETDVNALKTGMASDDVSKTYSNLDELNKQVDQLPFPALTIAPAKITPTDENNTFWQKVWNQSKQVLQQIIIVRRTDTDNVMLAPESKPFVYQNLHAQFENMMWALLHQNQKIYQASIDRATQWITHYFDQTAPITKQTLAELTSLKEKPLERQTIDLQPALNLFDQAIGSNVSS